MGILIFLFGSSFLYSVWLIAYALLVCSLGMLRWDWYISCISRYCGFFFVGYILIAFASDLFTGTPTLMGVSVIANFVSAVVFSKSVGKSLRAFRIIAWLSIFVYICKSLILGTFSPGALGLFSKNMLILPLIPFQYFYLVSRDQKRGSSISFDDFLYVLISIIAVLTISVSNTIFALFAVMALLVKWILTRRVLAVFIIIGMLTLCVSQILVGTAVNQSILNIIPDSDRPSLLVRLDKILAGARVDYDEPRVQIAKQYQKKLDITSVFLGTEEAPSFTYEEAGTVSRTSNPHNSWIYLHSKQGSASFLLLISIVMGLRYTWKLKRHAELVFLVGLLIRTFSDNVLVASGLSSFVIFTCLIKRATAPQFRTIEQVDC